MIALGETDPLAAEVPFTLPLQSNPINGLDNHVFVLGEVEIRLPNGGWFDVPLDQIFFIGEANSGLYAVRLTASQCAAPGLVSIHADVATAQPYNGEETIGMIGGDIGVNGVGYVPFFLPNADDPVYGSPITAYSFVLGEVRVRMPGAGWTNAVLLDIIETGFGAYKLRIQSAVRGKVYINATATGAQRFSDYVTVLDAGPNGSGSVSPITDLELLRTFMLIYDPDGNLADTCVPVGSELQISLSGSPFFDATGSFVRTGEGAFYYQSPIGERIEGFLGVKVKAADDRFIESIAYTKVPGMSGKLYIPMLVRNNGELAPGCDPSGPGELQMSQNGDLWEAATGTFAEVGDGLYYYVHDVLNYPGQLEIKVSVAGFDEEIAWGSLPGHASSGAIVLSNISPEQDSIINSASFIQFDITDDTSPLQLVIPGVLLDPNAAPEIVHDGTDFTPRYKKHSSRWTLPTGFRYRFLRTGGWPIPPQLRLWAADFSGNVLAL